MTRLAKLTAAVLVASAAAMNTSTAIADRGEIVRMNARGFDACKNIDANGGGWTGSVTGTLLDAAYGGSEEFFRVKYCFVSKSACRNFVATLENQVSGVSTIKRRSCKPR